MVSIICTTKNTWKLEKTWRPRGLQTGHHCGTVPFEIGEALVVRPVVRDANAWGCPNGWPALRPRGTIPGWRCCCTIPGWRCCFDIYIYLFIYLFIYIYIYIYIYGYLHIIHLTTNSIFLILTDVFLVSRVARAAFVSGFETCFLITESGIKAGESVEAWWVDGWRRKNGVTLTRFCDPIFWNSSVNGKWKIDKNRWIDSARQNSVTPFWHGSSTCSHPILLLYWLGSIMNVGTPVKQKHITHQPLAIRIKWLNACHGQRWCDGNAQAAPSQKSDPQGRQAKVISFCLNG